MKYYEMSFKTKRGASLHSNYANKEEAYKGAIEKDGVVIEVHKSSTFMCVNTNSPYVRWIGFVHLGCVRSSRGESIGSAITCRDCEEIGREDFKSAEAEQRKSEDRYYSALYV